MRRSFLAFDGQTADEEPVGPNAVLGAGGIVADDGTCAPFDNAAGPGQGQKQPLLGGPGDSLVPGTQPITMMRIGALGIAAVPSEVTKQMGIRMRAAAKEAAGGAVGDVILSGLTNGYSSYTSTPEEYDACHYEGSFTLFGRRQGPLYRDALVNVAKALFGGQAYEGAPEPAYRASEAGAFPAARAHARRRDRRRAARREREALRPREDELERRPSVDRRAAGEGARQDRAPEAERLEEVHDRRLLLRHPRARAGVRRLDHHAPDDGVHAGAGGTAS